MSRSNEAESGRFYPEIVKVSSPAAVRPLSLPLKAVPNSTKANILAKYTRVKLDLYPALAIDSLPSNRLPSIAMPSRIFFGKMTNFMRLAALFLAVSFVVGQVHAQIDRADFQGRVFLKGLGRVPYTLSIVYAPDPYSPDDFRRVANITLTLNGRKISIPKAAYTDLRDVHRPWPLYGDGSDPRKAIFGIQGGDASGSYMIEYTVNTERLVAREKRIGEGAF